MSERRPPDFAMLRAVEILASLHERVRNAENSPPEPIDEPILLASPALTLQIARTKRTEVERVLGAGFSYPARGWHTYAIDERGERCLLSAFYKNAILVAAEIYFPLGPRAPKLRAYDAGGFALEPPGVRVGMRAAAIASPFAPAIGGPAKVVYDAAYEARFPGGVAYAMGAKGIVQRLTLYADLRGDVE